MSTQSLLHINTSMQMYVLQLPTYSIDPPLNPTVHSPLKQTLSVSTLGLSKPNNYM